jgi:predicted O-methyltransferase YrrM
MFPAFQIRSFITYWLDAVEKYSLHSPFFFDFYTKVLKPSESGNSFPDSEQLRKKLSEDERMIEVQDYGAGSLNLSGQQRKVSDIARTSLSDEKFCQLYDRMIEYYQAQNIVELGTSFGINTLYLARGPGRKVTTFEGSKAICSIATSTFEFANARNITLIEGNIDATLPRFLERTRKVDFVFIDANHTYQATTKYFLQLVNSLHVNSIVVLDDIHYTREMEQAWTEIKKHPLVYGSADIYRAGILFFDPSLNKQHVVLQF